MFLDSERYLPVLYFHNHCKITGWIIVSQLNKCSLLFSSLLSRTLANSMIWQDVLRVRNAHEIRLMLNYTVIIQCVLLQWIKDFKFLELLSSLWSAELNLHPVSFLLIPQLPAAGAYLNTVVQVKPIPTFFLANFPAFLLFLHLSETHTPNSFTVFSIFFTA